MKTLTALAWSKICKYIALLSYMIGFGIYALTENIIIFALTVIVAIVLSILQVVYDMIFMKQAFKHYK